MLDYNWWGLVSSDVIPVCLRFYFVIVENMSTSLFQKFSSCVHDQSPDSMKLLNHMLKGLRNWDLWKCCNSCVIYPNPYFTHESMLD